VARTEERRAAQVQLSARVGAPTAGARDKVKAQRSLGGAIDYKGRVGASPLQASANCASIVFRCSSSRRTSPSRFSSRC